jgi:hypothetical protein
MNAGIDFIGLHTSEFRLESVNGWSIKAGNTVGEDQEIFAMTKDGTALSGTGYFMNRGKDSDRSCTVDVTARGLGIQFNPSTLQHDYLLTPDIEPALDMVKADLHTLGIELDLDNARLTRVDLTKQSQMPKPIQNYIGAMTMLKGKRMQGTAYPTGYAFGNKSRQSVMYNKTEQALKMKGIEIPENITRLEARWRGSKVVGKVSTGIGAGTLKAFRELTPGHLTESYDRFILGNVFRTDKGDQLAFNWDTEISLLQNLKADSPRKAIDRYFSYDGIEIALHRLGGLDGFKMLLMNAGWTRANAYNQAEKARRLIQEKAFIDSRRSQDTIASTIDELKQVFTA